MTQQDIQDLQKLAEQMWEGCDGCDDMDKYMWTGGFINGYLYHKFSSDTTENNKEINQNI